MKTEQIFISSKDIRYEEVMKMTEDFTSKLKLSAKEALRIRLLVEETLGMVTVMTDEFIAYINLESGNGQAKIILDVKTEMDADKKMELLSVSRSGKNSAVKGFMGKIGEIIENGMLNFTTIANLQDRYGSVVVPYADMGVESGVENAMDAAFVWSLNQYKNSLADDANADNQYGEAWDELEKSIVAKIADDVIVGVKKDRATLTIVKNIE